MHGNLAQLQRTPKDVHRWQKAQEQLLGGHHGAALAGYLVLTRRYPKIAELWFELGNAASGELDFPLANQAYLRAKELGAHNAPLLGMIGQQYQGLRQLDDARACYERALVADPNSVDAQINLAVWFEKERRLDEAWKCVQSCLARSPRDDQARYFKAFLLHRQKKPAEAEQELRQLIRDCPRYPYVKYASRHLLGVVLDELGQYEEAMRWLLEAKTEVRTIADTKALENAYDEGERQRRKMLDELTPETIRQWKSQTPPTTEGRQIAFLGGHPRSGTTLLEQVLDAHPDVLAFDEPVAFSQEITRHLEPREGEEISRKLHFLTTPQIAEMRQRYVKSLLREAPENANPTVLLDKNPSPTSSLHAWLRVFPELKVIIALRDPRDVVLSCFFLNIMLNSTNVNFLSLERTVKHYRDLMDVWLRMKELGGFDWIETRYEDVVADVAAEGRKATEFLGLRWHTDQERYFETARRKVLYAPTYHDVTQPVYNRAIGRWERYAAQIEPFLGQLEPYCQAFGYR